MLVASGLEMFPSKFVKDFVDTTEFCRSADYSRSLDVNGIYGCFLDAVEQFSHTTSLYSSSGRIYAKYIFLETCDLRDT